MENETDAWILKEAIRSSERKFYQKVTDLYATAIDYDKTALATKRFYATVQSKMHFAIHGHTAAELIVERANHKKNHMGQLNRRVSAYLDFAESVTLRHIPLTMEDWKTRSNIFI